MNITQNTILRKSLNYTIAWLCLAAPCCWASVGIDASNKYAWAENTGWIDTAPTNGGVTLQFNGSTGTLSGFAWSENVGWIKFGSDSSGPYLNNSVSNWGVNMDANGNLSGYAWSENVGWISFAPTYGGVNINTTNGQFEGTAWSENTGWISFKGVAPDYNVRTLAFDTQPNATPNWWLDQFSIAEIFDDGDGVPAWLEYVADTDPTNAASYFHINGLMTSSPFGLTFPSSTHRAYTLQYRDSLTTGTWSNVTDQIDITGNGGLASLQDSTSVSQRFYRVTVAAP